MAFRHFLSGMHVHAASKEAQPYSLASGSKTSGFLLGELTLKATSDPEMIIFG